MAAELDQDMSRLSRSRDPTSLTQRELDGENNQDGAVMSDEKETSIRAEPEVQPLHGGDDEASRLRDLATDVRDQDDLERAIGRQV